MSASRIVHLCEHCLIASETPRACPSCGSEMILCDAGEPGSDRSRPLYNEDGSLRTHAPRWWLERHESSGTGDSSAG